MKDNSEMTKEELIALGWIKKPSDKMQEKTEKQLTAVEWLFYRMIMDKTLSEKAEFMHEAKEMEKEQMEITWNNAIDAQLKDKWDSYDDFHKTTFK